MEFFLRTLIRTRPAGFSCPQTVVAGRRLRCARCITLYIRYNARYMGSFAPDHTHGERILNMHVNNQNRAGAGSSEV